MAFVTEHISDEDFLRYHLAETCHGNRADVFREWAIDRDRNIYLRRSWIDWQFPSNGYWSFYWKGVEGCVETYQLDFIVEPDGYLRKTIRLGLPLGIKESGPEDAIRNDFMEAYRSHTDHGKSIVSFIFL